MGTEWSRAKVRRGFFLLFQLAMIGFALDLLEVFGLSLVLKEQGPHFGELCLPGHMPGKRLRALGIGGRTGEGIGKGRAEGDR